MQHRFYFSASIYTNTIISSVVYLHHRVHTYMYMYVQHISSFPHKKVNNIFLFLCTIQNFTPTYMLLTSSCIVKIESRKKNNKSKSEKPYILNLTHIYVKYLKKNNMYIFFYSFFLQDLYKGIQLTVWRCCSKWLIYHTFQFHYKLSNHSA